MRYLAHYLTGLVFARQYRGADAAENKIHQGRFYNRHRTPVATRTQSATLTTAVFHANLQSSSPSQYAAHTTPSTLSIIFTPSARRRYCHIFEIEGNVLRHSQWQPKNPSPSIPKSISLRHGRDIPISPLIWVSFCKYGFRFWESFDELVGTHDATPSHHGIEFS